MPDWHRAHPDVELEIIGSDAVMDLRAEQVDVALRYARDMPRDGIAVELTRDRFYLVAAASLLDEDGVKSWKRLRRISYDWLPGDTKAPTWERWAAATRSRIADTGRPSLRFREELHALEAVVAGQGVAICSDLLLRKELAEGTVVRISPVSLDGYGLYLVTLPDKAATRSVQDFCEWMQEMFAGGDHA